MNSAAVCRIDANRLAVGARRDDAGSAKHGSARHRRGLSLQLLRQPASTGGCRKPSIGEGYTGGKNLDLSATLDTERPVMARVSHIDGDRPGGCGLRRRWMTAILVMQTPIPARHICSVSTDSVFSGGVLEATDRQAVTRISSGKNGVDVSGGLARELRLAFGTGVSINGNRSGRSGAAQGRRLWQCKRQQRCGGRTYLFSFTDSRRSTAPLLECDHRQGLHRWQEHRPRRWSRSRTTRLLSIRLARWQSH